MADNVTFQTAALATPPDGTVVSADEHATSGKVQRMKLAMSADGSDTHVPADADGLLVNLGTNNEVTVGGTVAVTQSGTWDEVGINDSGNSITVDGTVAVSNFPATQPVSGTVSVTEPVSVDDNGGSLTVDGAVTANAGTNLNTSALALEAGGNLAGAATSLAAIDDWDESDRAKVNLIVGQAGVQGGAGAVSATTQRVAIATDANAVTFAAGAEIKITDGTDDVAVTSEGNLQTITPNRTASGTLDALNEELEINTDGMGKVSFQVTASDLVGDITFRGTVDGTNWITNQIWDSVSFSFLTTITNPTADQLLIAKVAQYSKVHLRVTARTSGGATVSAIASPASTPIGDTTLVRAAYPGGGTAATALRTVTATDSPDVTHLATIAGDTTDIETAVEIMDDWDESDRAKVNLIVGQAGVQGAAGASTASTQRVAIATDANAVTVSGVSTAANQTTEITALQKIDDPVQVLGTDTYTEATSSGMTMGAVRRDADTTLVGTTNEFGPLQMDANGRLKVEAFDGGDSHTVDAADGTVFVRSNASSKFPVQVPATASNPSKAEDAASANADVGAAALAVRKATPAKPSDTDGDYEFLQMSAGRLWTSATIDAALPAGTANIGDVDVLTVPSPLSTAGNGTAATAHRVTIASDTTGVLAVTDNAGSLTVDAPNGTPVFARITDATLNMGVVDETGASAVDAAAVGGGTPHDSVDSGNPVKIGAKAATAVPTAVAAADRVKVWADLYGRQIVQPGVPVGTEKWATAQYTSAQTGTALLTPTSGKKLIITSYQIQVGGTTAGTVQLWFGGAADTTYTRGTDRTIFDGEFAPSATLKPGALQTKESGWVAAAADDVLRVTTSAAINPITFTVWGYEV